MQGEIKKPETAEECLDFLKSTASQVTLANANVMTNYQFLLEIERAFSVVKKSLDVKS
jgi:ABC-type thiamine transport system substrate-binding protein